MSEQLRTGVLSHPHAVAIPDPARVQGLRAYREPEIPHPLQLQMLDIEGERSWTTALAALLTAGEAEAAVARLTDELAGFNGALARLAREAATAEEVALDGWDDLLPILSEWEGPPITAITLGMTNPPDLAFEGAGLFEPELLLSLYSDEVYPFSARPADALLAECGTEQPGWVGHEEDVEFHAEPSGLAALNTALVRCPHRHFLRDGRDEVQGRAPGGYVEYLLGCWLRSALLLRAAQQAVAAHGLPEGCRMIVGAVGVTADFVTVIEPMGRRGPQRAAAAQPAFAPLTIKPWVPKEDPTADAPAPATLRQRLVSTPETTPEPPPAGWMARMFGRLRRRG